MEGAGPHGRVHVWVCLCLADGLLEDVLVDPDVCIGSLCMALIGWKHGSYGLREEERRWSLVVDGAVGPVVLSLYPLLGNLWRLREAKRLLSGSRHVGVAAADDSGMG